MDTNLFLSLTTSLKERLSQQFVLGHFYVVVIIWDVNYKEQIVMG